MADGDLEKYYGLSGIKWSYKWHIIYKNSSLQRNYSTQYEFIHVMGLLPDT